MKLPNPLGSRTGRMIAFFLLYMTEGIPYGFTSIVMVYQLREQGLDNFEIGNFQWALYFPWQWKWLAGPFVDLISFGRHGHRRVWILICQFLMVAALLTAMPVDFGQQLKLLIGIVLIHNVFAATQDVAIDALACRVLEEDERGLASGLMFSGTYLGSLVGGSAIIFLLPYIPFELTYLLAGSCVLAVTFFIVIPIREPENTADNLKTGALRANLIEYIVTAFRSMFTYRLAFFGLLLALLPMGPHALTMKTQVFASDFGMTTNQIGSLQSFSIICSAAGCVIGGVASDKLGRRRMLALFIVTGCVPTMFFAQTLASYGWHSPPETFSLDRQPLDDEFFKWFWICTLSFSLTHGMMYGTRAALFLDISNPVVAGIQFTAYMSVLNLVLGYTTWWQGFVSLLHGYPMMLRIDSALGLLGLLLLPFVCERKTPLDV
ncbi:MAG: hypothetical protein CMJ78_26215 [Planctomycetaceae bacterium]|nr:hypothetical protein [Planctomycetaceae bacterium]